MLRWIRFVTYMVATLVVFCLFIYFYGSFQKVDYADIGIVLGNQVLSEDQPSERLKARLDEATRLYQNKKVKRILVSGGVGKEGYSEARVMANYLINHDVRDTDIILDEHGINTHQTAVNSLALIGKDVSVVGISQSFHLIRVKLSLANAGFKRVQIASPRFYEFRDIYSTLREIPAIGKYFVLRL